MRNDTYLIEQEDIELAQDICSDIKDGKIRNRAMANVIGAHAARKYFDDGDIDVNSGVHNIPQILKDTDISDVYIRDNYIDVRICFDENGLYVPKVHFDRNTLPKAYMFLCVSEDASSANVLGFVLPEDISKSQCNDGYYKVSPDMLKSYYDVEALLNSVDDEGLSKNFTESVFLFLDGNLTDKKVFYSELISSKQSRKYLKAASLADKIFKSVPDDFRSKLPQRADNTSDLSVNEELQEYNGTVEPMEELAQENEQDFSEGLVLEEYNPDVQDTAELGEVLPPVSNNADFEELVFEDELPKQEPTEGYAVENETDEVSEISDDEFTELSKFDYSTEVMPSISSIDDEVNGEVIGESGEMAEVADAPESVSDLSVEDLDKISEFEQFVPEDNPPQVAEENNQEQLDNLFTEEAPQEVKTAPKKSSKLPLLGVLAVAGALGYFGYTKYFASMPNLDKVPKQDLVSENKTAKDNAEPAKQEEDAMPIETVENTEVNLPKEDTVAVDIPKMEQNLTSIDISNLTVTWEVPSSYTNNTTAKRYFLKIGKALQLNLKTELMVMSAPPIPNVMSTELEFNSSTNKFSVKRMVKSSGVERVDKVIMNTINTILDINLGVNMSVFKTLQGNPVIIIKL